MDEAKKQIDTKNEANISYKKFHMNHLKYMSNDTSVKPKGTNCSSKDILRAAIDNSADSIFLIDKNQMRFIDVNYTACESTGYSREELLKMGPQDIKPEFSKEKLKKVFESILIRDGDKEVISSVHQRKDGSIFPVEVFLTSLEHSDIIVASVRDISERKLTEKKLQESEKKFLNLFNNLKDGVFVHPISNNNQPGKFILTNKAASQMLGYSQEKFKNMTPWDLDDPSNSREYIPKVMKRLKEKGEVVFEAVQIDINDRKIPVEVNSTVVDFHGKPHIISVTRDISKRKKMESKKREYQRILASTLESVDSLLLLIDKNYRVVLCNWKDHEWVPEEKRHSRPFCYKVLKNLDAPCQYCPPVETFHDGKPRWYEDQNPIDGSYKEISVIPIFDETHNVSYVLENVRDVTDQKKAKLKLKELNQGLERKVKQRTERIQHLLQQKDEFINQLGHDLKNPLGPFLQLLPILKEHVSDDKDKQMIEVLNRNANYMRNLVKKTINLAKLNSSKTRFVFECCLLFDIVDEVIRVNHSMFDDQNIIVKNNISRDCFVYVDEIHIQEVFTNLFNNAVKYTNGSGKIIVDATSIDEEVVVSVSDTGIGISADQIDFLFDEYYKADSSRHDFESSGLGLPICKRIIEKHGGRIWVESPGIGKGSTFYFTLPKSKEIVTINE